MAEAIVWLVGLIVGCGSAGIGLAWLNDRRHAANARRFPPKDAKAILEERFAKGEIDEADYARRMHLLTYGPPLELDPPTH